MPPADPRRQVGSYVYTKVTNVASLMECTRRFGQRTYLKEVRGIVCSISYERTETNQLRYSAPADYYLEGSGMIGWIVVKKKLSIRQVLKVPTNHQDFVSDDVIVAEIPDGRTQISATEESGSEQVDNASTGGDKGGNPVPKVVQNNAGGDDRVTEEFPVDQEQISPGIELVPYSHPDPAPPHVLHLFLLPLFLS